MTGIGAIPFDRIPEQWDSRWFSEFIRDVLSLLDVRNAIGEGITVSGQPGEVATLSSNTVSETYVVLSASSNLTDERILAVEAAVLGLTDNGAGSTIVISVDANGITFAKIQQITGPFIGRISGTGDIEELTETVATALLDDFVGDSGSGGTKGLVLAPTSGDAAADKFLFADGTWAVVQDAAAAIRGLVLEAAAVNDLNQTISDPPTQTEVQDISDKIDELLAVKRTAGQLT